MDTNRTSHAPRIARAIVLLTVTVLGLAACGRVTGAGSGGDTTPGRIAHPTGANDLLLRIEYTGGFVAPEALLQRYPSFSLYGDGTVITQGAQIEIYPQPALPPLISTHVDEEGIQRILHAAIAAGLDGPDVTYAGIPIADAPDTVFTLNLDGRTHTTTVTALGMDVGGSSEPGGPPGTGGGSSGSTGSAGGTVVPEPTASEASGEEAPGLSDEERRARVALLALQTKLSDLRSWLPAGSVGDDLAYEPTAMRVFVTDGAPDDQGGTLHQQDVIWPLGTPLATFGQPIETPLSGGPARCGVVEGSDLELLMPKAERANQLSPWVSEGARFGLSFRPLLPDESGC